MPLSNVTVRQHTCTGRSYTDVVQAESWEEVLQLAADRTTASRPLPDFKPRRDAADCPRCADISGPLAVALRAGGGTRSAPHRRPTRVLASGEVGEGRSWSRPSPTGASHRSAIIPPVTQPLPAQGHFPKDRFGNDPLRDRHLPSGRHLAPLGDRIRPPARLCLGPMAGRPVRSAQEDSLVSKSVSRGQQQPLQAWSLEGAVGDATFGFHPLTAWRPRSGWRPDGPPAPDARLGKLAGDVQADLGHGLNAIEHAIQRFFLRSAIQQHSKHHPDTERFTTALADEQERTPATSHSPTRRSSPPDATEASRPPPTLGPGGDFDRGPFGKIHVRFGKAAKGSGPRPRWVPMLDQLDLILRWYLQDMRSLLPAGAAAFP